jgi:hypothetical protein
MRDPESWETAGKTAIFFTDDWMLVGQGDFQRLGSGKTSRKRPRMSTNPVVTKTKADASLRNFLKNLT